MTIVRDQPPVEAVLPPRSFPDISFAITEPTHPHPDAEDEHVVVAATALDTNHYRSSH
jgi:hypothetical protein